MHNLRTILSTSDAEGLADRVSRVLQERVAHAQRNLWRAQTWQQLPPCASISVCRADGASIRAALRPQVVVPRMVQQLQHADWPPVSAQAAVADAAVAVNGSAAYVSGTAAVTGSALSPEPSTADYRSSADASCAACGTATAVDCDAPSICSTAPLPSGLLRVLQLCQQRMGMLHSQQLPQLQHMCAGRVCSTTSHSTQQDAASARPVWRPNMAALQAVAGKLPDAATARYGFSSGFCSLRELAGLTNKAKVHCSVFRLIAHCLLRQCSNGFAVPLTMLLMIIGLVWQQVLTCNTCVSA